MLKYTKEDFNEAYGHLFFFWHRIKQLPKLYALQKVIDDMQKAGYDTAYLQIKLNGYKSQKKT